MPKPTKQVSAKEQYMAVLSLLSEQDSCENIAARYNVTPKQLLEWQKTFQAGGEAALNQAAAESLLAFPGSSMITSCTCLNHTAIRVQGIITLQSASEELVETYAYVYEGDVAVGDEPPNGATTHGTNLTFDFNLACPGALGTKTVGVWAECRQFGKSKATVMCGTTSSTTTSSTTSTTTPLPPTTTLLPPSTTLMNE